MYKFAELFNMYDANDNTIENYFEVLSLITTIYWAIEKELGIRNPNSKEVVSCQ